MPETPRQQFESGETVQTLEELVEGLSGQPKGFSLMMNVWWGDHNSIWGKVEQMTGLKVSVRIKGMGQYEGKPTCMIEIVVV